MSVEPGWYYAEGDPEGTKRLWNGEAWVGFPIVQPGFEQAQTEQPTYTRTPGHVSLKVPAVLAQVALVLLALAWLSVSIAYFRLAGSADGFEPIPDDVSAQFGLAYLLQLATTLFAAITFVIWFSMAYRNISLWTRTSRSQIWTLIVWIVPFINLVRPMNMMLELVEHSPRPDRRGELSPTPVILWWFLWILPGLAGGLLTINVATNDLSEVVKSVFVIQGVVSLLSTVSIVIAIYLVQMITDSQERHLG